MPLHLFSFELFKLLKGMSIPGSSFPRKFSNEKLLVICDCDGPKLVYSLLGFNVYYFIFISKIRYFALCILVL